MKVNMPCAELLKNPPPPPPPENATLESGMARQNCTPDIVSEELQEDNHNSCRIVAQTTEHPTEVLPLNTTTSTSVEVIVESSTNISTTIGSTSSTESTRATSIDTVTT
jgi:hypothetical protein